MGARTIKGDTVKVNLILSSVLSMIKSLQNVGESTSNSSKIKLENINQNLRLLKSKQVNITSNNTELPKLKIENDNDDEDGSYNCTLYYIYMLHVII